MTGKVKMKLFCVLLSSSYGLGLRIHAIIIIGFIFTTNLGIQQVNYAEETNISPNRK